jgi:hydroxyacylglutathione hydrolase
VGVDAEHGGMVMARLTVSAVPVLTDNYVWLIRDPDSGEVAAVDPSVAEPVLEAVAPGGLRLTQVLNTHWHPDHTGGNDGIRDATGCTITAPAEAERVSKIDRIVAEGNRVTVAGAEAVVWDIPAHTAGHIAYYFEDERMIFVGDTMFAMGCGRLFEGTAEQMYSNMQRIASLPGDVRIYCGHEYTLANARFAAHVEPDNPDIARRLERVSAMRERGEITLPTTVAEERATNPFVRASDRQEFARLRSAKDSFR